MKRFFLSVLLCASLLVVQGQTDSSRKRLPVRFSSLNQVGLLEGQVGSAFLLQTVNGVAYKGWFAGIGAGLDYYRFRGLPLFVDVRKNVLKESFPLYVYADAGIHFPWVRNNQRSNWMVTDYKNGLYLDAGLQYLWRLSESNAVSFSIGYTEKKITEVQRSSIQCIMPPCFDNKQQFEYRLKRISVKTGFRF